jgi:methionine-rich copper-binding protein CopC
MTRAAIRPDHARLRRAAQATALAMLLALAAATASRAVAHAELESAVPAAGSVVHEPPARLVLRFSQRFEPAFTTVKILDANGQQVAGDTVEIDGADPRGLGVVLPKLAPGAYRVHWRVLSVDTHVSQGQFGFVVSP